MGILIPVFLSAPSVLNQRQQAVYAFVSEALHSEKLQPRALGRSDFPQSDPATEVYYVARACYGGVVLGFSQIDCNSAVLRRGTDAERTVERLALPTPWNQLEAGMLIAMRRPLLVFAEPNIQGGVFDQGAVPGFLQRFDPENMTDHDWEGVRERIRVWSASVRMSFRN